MQKSFVPLLAASALLFSGATAADGPTGTALGAQSSDSALARACVDAGARAFDAPPASIFVYDPNPAGGIGMWAGGGQFVCQRHSPNSLILIPVPAI